MRRKGKGLIDSDYPADLYASDYFKWERRYLEHKNRVSVDDIKREPDKYIIFLPHHDIERLVEFDPPEGSVYIRSHPEPYTEEMELQENVLVNWLERYNLKGRQVNLFDGTEMNVTQIHVTGHMSYEETKYLINEISPKHLIPIHTLYPESFMDMHDSVIIPEHNKTLEL